MGREHKEIHLRSRPEGLPTADNFILVTVPTPRPDEGEVLVENLYMSVDPYMRGRMRAGRSYAAPFEIGQPLTGGAVGRVVESRAKALQEGDYVLGRYGWREFFVAPAAELTLIEGSVVPLPAFLGVMGMPGMTAYVGLLDIGRPLPGETVFVSAAAGAVGSVVCQIARLKGCRVVGSAGSERKLAWLKETARIDEAINYRTVDSLREAVAAACPDGIDIYFENVGGEHLEAALAAMNNEGRIPVCGLISQYNAQRPSPAPRNLPLIITRRLRLQGFIVSDHGDRRGAFLRDMSQWIAAGEMRWAQTIVDGLENAPTAFIGLFEGENLGKMLVRVSGSEK